MNLELVENVLNKLIEKKLKISFAESCTGGLASSTLVTIPNASLVMDESIVTYSNEAKIKYLGVDANTILNFGVVSEEVAAQMSSGIAKASGSSIGVGITGIAGPGGSTSTKPVGLVCFGFSINGIITTSKMFFSNKTRREVMEASVDFVFDQLNKLV